MRQITRLFLTCQLTLALIGWSGQRTGADAADTIEGTVPRPPARLIVQPSVRRPDSVIFALSGKIEAPLARQIEEAFEQHKDHVRRIVLKLNSGGGSVRAGRKAIEVLQRIKKTHQLDTVVEAGRQCGSMCVFLYAQGQQRYAAAASLWLFHEVSYKDPATGRVNKLDRDKWLSLIDSYLVPAGVSSEWIVDLKQHAFGSDYWRTGEALVREHSGLVLRTTSDEVRRRLYGKVPPQNISSE